jgi:hypothetical protein
MTQEGQDIVQALHRRVDEVAGHGTQALGELAELLYYAEEEETLPFLRRFVFMASIEKQVLLTLADRMARLRRRAEAAMGRTE